MLQQLARALGLSSPAERALDLEAVTALGERDRFSDYLPYDGYERATEEYLNADGTVGRLWECSPLTFLSGASADHLASLLRQDFPKDAVIQFMLYPDRDIDSTLQRYLALKTRVDDAIQEGARRYAEHLRQGTQGLAQMQHIRVRNFRLFVAIKSRTPLPKERIAAFVEPLTQAGLAPRALPPEELLAWLRRLLNSKPPTHVRAYDPRRLIRKQIIQAETAIESYSAGLKLGSRYAACLTPKCMPNNEQIDVLGINRLIGGIGGPEDDGAQLNSEFLWTVSIFFDVTAGAIKRKASSMGVQRVGGLVAKEIRKRLDELDWVIKDLDQQRYVDVLPSLWVFGDSEEELNAGVARAWTLWDSQKFQMQQETRIQQPMLIAALPFGLYNESKNIATLDRHYEMSAQAAALMLPVQGDFSGRMEPILMYVGRKGQLATIDVFDKGANNHNFLVCAGTGAGKSFQLNALVNNYYAAGAKVRIADLGYSYQKQCAIAKGRFIDVAAEAKETRLCLNPFPSIGQGEDKAYDEQTTVQVVLTMDYSATGTHNLTETHYSLAKDAVRFAYQRDGGEYGIDHVEEYLRTYPKSAGTHAFEGAVTIAHEMAFNLRDFTSSGKYGRLFNGKSTLSMGSDDFVVLELEPLMAQPELFRVVSMQVINAVTQDLYLSDRTAKRFILFEEAWKYFRTEAGDSVALSLIAKIIEEAYRRARKYGGSTGIVTQSPLDLETFGAVGKVIKANSAFKFFLESSDYQAAVDAKILDYRGLVLDMAKSVKNNRPRYSELLFDTPFGIGVGRLCVDPWTYWMNTSTAPEVARFKALLQRGMSAKQALDTLAGA